MVEITEELDAMAVADAHKRNRIQVSNTKKPLFFYVKLAKVSRSLFYLFIFWKRFDLLFGLMVFVCWYWFGYVGYLFMH